MYHLSSSQWESLQPRLGTGCGPERKSNDTIQPPTNIMLQDSDHLSTNDHTNRNGSTTSDMLNSQCPDAAPSTPRVVACSSTLCPYRCTGGINSGTTISEDLIKRPLKESSDDVYGEYEDAESLGYPLADTSYGPTPQRYDRTLRLFAVGEVMFPGVGACGVLSIAIIVNTSVFHGATGLIVMMFQ